MRMSIVKGWLAAGIIALSAQATSGFAASAQTFEPIAELPDGQALIYLYRKDDANSAFKIKANHQVVTVLKPNGYYPLVTEPGTIELSSKVSFKMFATGIMDKAFAKKHTVEVQAEPGKVYYVTGEPQGAGITPEPQELVLMVVPNEQGAREIMGAKKMKMARGAKKKKKKKKKKN